MSKTRDQLNQPGQVRLMLVMSGADRDKLLRLVVSASAAFYGSQIQPLPPLDTDFIAHVAGLVKAQRQRTPALVWKSARAEYAVEDAAMHRWYQRRVSEGRWPLVSAQGALGAGDEDKTSGSRR